LEWLKLRSKGNKARKPGPLKIAIVSAAAFALCGAYILALLDQRGRRPWSHGIPYLRWILPVAIFLAAVQQWLMWRNRAARNGYWPKRFSVPPAPDSDNAEAANNDPS
jgi:O-antigen/teichoic acid export membrane protein